MSNPNIDINVSGPVQPSSTYKTVVLKGNQSFASQVTKANAKYIIKHDFDLGGETVIIPANCILEFDGGSLSNGTLAGTIDVRGNYKEHFNVEIEGTIITKDFVLCNSSDVVNKSKIEACRNGIVIDGNIVLESSTEVYTDITSSPSGGKITLGTSPSAIILAVKSSGINISGIEIDKPMPTSDTSEFMRSRLIHSTGFENITISDCVLKGAVKIQGDINAEWGKADYISNINIIGNTFIIDFTHLIGNIEDDVIMLIGCRNSNISNNNIDAVNVNRIFKFTGIYKSEGSGVERIESTYNDIENVVVYNNHIHSYCDPILASGTGNNAGTGKQVADLYCNPRSVYFLNNDFDIENHVSIIENKSVQNTHSSYIKFANNIVKSNSCFTWICDKDCTLDIDGNDISFEGNYFGNYDIFRIMAIERLIIKNNSIKENLQEKPVSISYIISTAYSSGIHTTIFNSFNNKYIVDICGNNISLNEVGFLYLRTYDNTDTTLHDYDKLGERLAEVDVDGNHIEYSRTNSAAVISSINALKNIVFKNNSVINKADNDVYAITGLVDVLSNTIIEDANNILHHICHTFTTTKKKANEIKGKFKNQTKVTDGFRFLASNLDYDYIYSLVDGGMHVYNISNFARNLFEIETTDTGTTSYKILLGCTESTVNVLRIEAGGDSVITAEVKSGTDGKLLIVRKYTKNSFAQGNFSFCTVHIKGLIATELPYITPEVQNYEAPASGAVIRIGVSDEPIRDPEAFADKASYITNAQTALIKGYFNMVFAGDIPGVFGSQFGYQRLVGPKNRRPANLGSGIMAQGFRYFDTDINKGIIWNGSNWIDEDGTNMNNVTKVRGTTSERTTMSNGWSADAKTASEGLRFYDTTLHKYVLWNGSDWVNLDGSALS